MQHYKYLSEADKHNWLIDRIKINLSSLIKYQEVTKMKDDGFKLGNNILIPNSNVKIRIDCMNEKVNILKSFLHFNLNEEIRCYIENNLMIKLGIDDIGTTWSFKDNVIPSVVRIKLQEKNISLNFLRQRALDKFYNIITKAERIILGYLKDTYDVMLHGVNFSLNEVEVNYDVIGHPWEELAHNSTVREKFKCVVSEFKDDSEFASDTGDRTLRSVWGSCHDKRPDDLSGKHFDGSYCKFYIKETSKIASINRYEREFKKDQLVYNVGKLTFITKEDFIDKLTCLAHITFDGIKEVLVNDCIYSEDEKTEIASKYIEAHFGTHGDEVLKALTTGMCSIHTGTCRPCIAQKVREVAKTTDLLVKKDTGVYMLNLKWLLSHKV